MKEALSPGKGQRAFPFHTRREAIAPVDVSVPMRLSAART